MIVVAGVVRSPYIFVLLKTCLYEAATGELCLDGGLVVGVCVCVSTHAVALRTLSGHVHWMGELCICLTPLYIHRKDQ